MRYKNVYGSLRVGSYNRRHAVFFSFLFSLWRDSKCIRWQMYSIAQHPYYSARDEIGRVLRAFRLRAFRVLRTSLALARSATAAILG